MSWDDTKVAQDDFLSADWNAMVTYMKSVVAASGKIKGSAVIRNEADNTKLAAFDTSAIATGTTRTYVWPNQNGTVAMTSDIPSDTGITQLTGDVTAGPGSGSQASTIANDAVTFAKMQNIATNSLVGRDTASSGDPENILLNATLEMDGAGNLQRAALSGDVTASAGNNTTTIANDAVTYAKMQNVSATDKVLGRSTIGSGDVEEIDCTAAGRALIDDATASDQRTTLGLGTLATQSGTFSGTSSGTNTGDNAVNSLYSGLVTNATHTGDATGSGALTVVAINGTTLSALGTGVLKNTTATGVPFISKVAITEPATSATLTIADGQTLTVNGSATITNGTHSGTNTGDQTITLTGGVTGSGVGSFAATVVTNANLTGDVTSVGNATTAKANLKVASVQFVIDGGGSAITTGLKGCVEVPFAGTITAARMFADQSGSIVVDIWKDTYANYPPVDADSITSATPPTISATTKSEDTTLSSWIVSVAAGDIIAFNVDSATTVTRVTVSLTITRT